MHVKCEWARLGNALCFTLVALYENWITDQNGNHQNVYAYDFVGKLVLIPELSRIDLALELLGESHPGYVVHSPRLYPYPVRSATNYGSPILS